MNRRTIEALASLLDRTASTSLHVKTSKLGPSIDDVGVSIRHRVALANGLIVGPNGTFQCPNSGQFTDELGTDCALPGIQDIANVARGAADARRGVPVRYRPGEVTDTDLRKGVARDNAFGIAEGIFRNYFNLVDRDDVISNGERSKLFAQFSDGLPDRASTSLAAPAIAIGPRELLRMLRDGRFKSQFETNKSRGIYNPTGRRWFETTMGVPETTLDEDRPIYGFNYDTMEYLDGTRNTLVGIYGEVIVHLKPEVQERTTVSFGDSLDHKIFPLRWDTLKNDTSSISGDDVLAAAGRRWIKEAAMLFLDDEFGEENGYHEYEPLVRSDYIETQHHGGLTIDDIDFVEFPEGGLPLALGFDRYGLQGEIWDALTALDLKHNLPTVQESVDRELDDARKGLVESIKRADSADIDQIFVAVMIELMEAGPNKGRYSLEERDEILGNALEKFKEGNRLRKIDALKRILDERWTTPDLIAAADRVLAAYRSLDENVKTAIRFDAKTQDRYSTTDACRVARKKDDGMMGEDQGLTGRMINDVNQNKGIEKYGRQVRRGEREMTARRSDSPGLSAGRPGTRSDTLMGGTPPHGGKLVATRNGEDSLWDIGDGRGVVTSTVREVSTRSLPIDSILARGYWDIVSEYSELPSLDS